MTNNHNRAEVEAKRLQAYATALPCASAAAFDHALATVCGCTDAAIAMWRSTRWLPAKLLPKQPHADEAKRLEAYAATPPQTMVSEFDAAVARQCRCSRGAIGAWRRSRKLPAKVVTP